MGELVSKSLELLRACNKTVGDCPDFAESSEQNGTVPFSGTFCYTLLLSCLLTYLPN
jgi:hypothetical protein